MDEIERYYINIYHTLDPEFGYNFEGRGNKNKILSEETLKKRSNSISGRRHPFYGKFNEEAPFYGHKHSEEAKKKISDALSGENNYNYGKPLPLNVKKKISLNKNTSSYFRVSKHHDKRYKQGFIWQYSYYENNLRKKIRRVNLESLEKEVKSQGLEWFKISDENIPQESEDNSSQISNRKKEYAYVVECGFTK